MNSIFDENSDFLKYIKQKEGQNPQDSAQPNPIPKAANAASETFVLDLKNHQLSDPGPVEEVPVKKIGQNTPAAPQPAPPTKFEKKLNKVNNLNSSSSSFSAFIVDKIKFIFVSILIFSITFVGINWSAYSKIFENWFLNISGVAIDSPLNQFTNPNQNPDTSIASNLELVPNTDIPKLDLEVTPPGTRIIIPRLNTNVPVISMSTNTLISRNWDALENDIQQALRSGVVHYPGTPFPNQSGNVVLTGHSSYYPWDPGRFKDVFVVLHQAVVGDELVVFYNQKKYTYQVTEIKKVMPTEVNVLGDTGDDRLTLITCTPIGTNLKRLIVTAKPIKT